MADKKEGEPVEQKRKADETPKEGPPSKVRVAESVRRADPLLAEIISDSSYASLKDSLRQIIGETSPLNERLYRDLVGTYDRDISRTFRQLFGTSSDAWLDRINLQPQISEFEAEVAKLRRDIDEKAKALLSEQAGAKKKEDQIGQLQRSLKELNDKQRLAHLLSRVGDAAQKRLLESEEFRAEFSQDAPRAAYVLSIDIRRSTELMLKAREPKLFAEFIITLATRLRQVILENLGVFDKFTGDGVLAFFPEFFSGRDAGYLSLKSAAECHEVFNGVYKAHRHCFASVLKDTGLGIGLDYGAVQLVQIGGDFTVVGTPVVYACRMSGATAGATFVNQPAYERLFDLFSEYCDFEETELEIKHEGRTLAHRARLNGKPYSTKPPGWFAHSAPA